MAEELREARALDAARNLCRRLDSTDTQRVRWPPGERATVATGTNSPPALSLPFDELQEVVGFPEYYAEEARYHVQGKPGEEA